MKDFELNLPGGEKHKGQNGRLLIVGGSQLFHAASLWSAAVAAHLVDMVFYASTVENNELIKIAKNGFRDGIVIERKQIGEYAEQADVILLGPGMTRGEGKRERLEEILAAGEDLAIDEWQSDTYLITNYLLAKYSQKKFVLDAGALQMVEVDFLTSECILTPHQKEWERLLQAAAGGEERMEKLRQVTVLRKGAIDEVVVAGEVVATIMGGNAGLTKGGSGDALAGLVAGLYCYNEAGAASYWGSKTIKKAAEILYEQVGPFFTTSELGGKIPAALWGQSQKQWGE
jgi:NAD(P)H-hydrate epimerase